MYFVDGLQYSNWSEKIFKEMNDAALAAVHVTIAYHENFREVVANFSKWNDYFEKFSDLIMPGTCAADIDLARESQRTAISLDSRTPRQSKTTFPWWRSVISLVRDSCSFPITIRACSRLAAMKVMTRVLPEWASRSSRK